MTQIPEEEYNLVHDGSSFKILKKGTSFYISASQKNVSLSEINEVVETNKIEVKNFANLRSSLTTSLGSIVYFGEERVKIVLTVSNDNMKAYVSFGFILRDLPPVNKLKAEITELLEKNGIVYGINLEPLENIDFVLSGKNILIAEGTPAENGKNSTTKIIDPKEIKPKELDCGRVDHQNLGIINWVNIDDWVGEWTFPTPGVFGYSIKGTPVIPKHGKLNRLLYDQKTLYESPEADRIVLLAKINGAFKVDSKGKIGISNHLIVYNVDYSTGNIDFDGFVSVNGTIAEGFSVIATNDIEINSVEGLTNVKEIISREGDVYISGGVNGKGSTLISGQNISVKYVSNSSIFATKKLTVTNYIFNSNIEAKEILMIGIHSQIAGSDIKKVFKIIVGNLGNVSEHKTIIELSCLDKEVLSNKLQSLSTQIEENKSQIFKIEKLITDFLVPSDKVEPLISAKSELYISNQILEKEYHDIKYNLSMKGEAQITILNKAFPGVRISTKHDTKRIEKPCSRTIFSVKDGMIVSE